MDKNIAVIYQSHYGATKQYAEWIAEELNAELIERKKASAATLGKYDIAIYGGGLYASGILGADLVAKNAVKNLVLFTVGLADPQETDYSDILKRSFPDASRQPVKTFHLRGFIDYKKLNIAHRGLMAMLKKAVEKKPESERSSEDKAILETYGGAVDFTDRTGVAPLVAYVRELEGS
jgi:flavodoxin